jgi:transposase-like protein
MPVEPKTAQQSALYLRAIELLEKPGASFSKVAEELGIGRRTLWTWRQDPLYRLVESEYLDGAMSAARAELKAMVLDAVKVLRESLTAVVASKEDAAQWKVRQDAAKAVLDRVGITEKTIGEDKELSETEIDALLAKLGLVQAQEGARH